MTITTAYLYSIETGWVIPYFRINPLKHDEETERNESSWQKTWKESRNFILPIFGMRWRQCVESRSFGCVLARWRRSSLRSFNSTLFIRILLLFPFLLLISRTVPRCLSASRLLIRFFNKVRKWTGWIEVKFSGIFTFVKWSMFSVDLSILIVEGKIM